METRDLHPEKSSHELAGREKETTNLQQREVFVTFKEGRDGKPIARLLPRGKIALPVRGYSVPEKLVRYPEPIVNAIVVEERERVAFIAPLPAMCNYCRKANFQVETPKEFQASEEHRIVAHPECHEMHEKQRREELEKAEQHAKRVQEVTDSVTQKVGDLTPLEKRSLDYNLSPDELAKKILEERQRNEARRRRQEEQEAENERRWRELPETSLSRELVSVRKDLIQFLSDYGLGDVVTREEAEQVSGYLTHRKLEVWAAFIPHNLHCAKCGIEPEVVGIDFNPLKRYLVETGEFEKRTGRKILDLEEAKKAYPRRILPAKTLGEFLNMYIFEHQALDPQVEITCAFCGEKGVVNKAETHTTRSRTTSEDRSSSWGVTNMWLTVPVGFKAYYEKREPAFLKALKGEAGFQFSKDVLGICSRYGLFGDLARMVIMSKGTKLYYKEYPPQINLSDFLLESKRLERGIADFQGIPDLRCKILVKIAKDAIAAIEKVNALEPDTQK